MHPQTQQILITGANGNLGVKLAAALLAEPWCRGLVAVDRAFSTGRLPDDGRIRHVQADLLHRDGIWREALRGIDAVVHFAAQNPYPNASWADAAASLDMTCHLVEAAAEAGVGRLVFASSNHVMGGYKETPVSLRPGALTPGLDPLPGTRWRVDGKLHDQPAYAAAKLMGERVLGAKARRNGLTAVSLRIGWCQPGANRPETISASGMPGQPGEDTPEARHDLRWFRQMWLSNRDFTGFVLSALQADAGAWPDPAVVVNAMSANTGAPWSRDEGRRLLGYEPRDDLWRELGLDAAT